jgi:kynurenine formamidase
VESQANLIRLRAVASKVSNWGRWGSDDELGTLNLITPSHVSSAARLIKLGRVFDLSIAVGSDGPQDGRYRTNPVHLMAEINAEAQPGGTMRFSDDFLLMYLQAGTQWDALSHIMYDGHLYNGVEPESITATGAGRLSVVPFSKRMVGRGVLLDIARLHGVDWLEYGQVITPEDLNSAARSQGVDIQEGDILLFRTGWRRRFLSEHSPQKFKAAEPGIGVAAVEWLHAHGIAALCADNYGIEAIPGDQDYPPMSVHMLLIRDMGMPLGEIFDLEELAEDCAANSTYEFFFCAQPLKVTGAVGSPVNPIAIK